MLIVLDASAAVEWLLLRPGHSKVVSRIADPDVTLHAPGFVNVEVMSALRGLVLGGGLSPERAAEALGDLADADIQLHDPAPLIDRAWQLRHNCSSYDAVYVALAEVLDATLLTADARLARAVDGIVDCVVVA